jgi:hypothetical protein
MDQNENFIHIKQGWCYWTLEPYPLIYNLFVDPKYRNQGWAKHLLRMVKQEIDKIVGYPGIIQIQAEPAEPKEAGIDKSRLIEFYKHEGLKVIPSQREKSMGNDVEVGLINMLIKDNKSLRDAGCKLAEASIMAINEHDGLHRLSLAVAEWCRAVASEGGRGA